MGDPSLVERAQGAYGLRRRARALARVSLDQQVLLGDRLRERERGLGCPPFRHESLAGHSSSKPSW